MNNIYSIYKYSFNKDNLSFNYLYTKEKTHSDRL